MVLGIDNGVRTKQWAIHSPIHEYGPPHIGIYSPTVDYKVQHEDIDDNTIIYLLIGT